MTLKSSFQSFLAEESRGELAADGLLLTAGAFAALAGIGFVIEWMTPGSIETAGLALGIVLWLLSVSGFVVGPVLAWRLHGRRLDTRGITALVIGLFVGNGAMYLMAMVVAGLSFLLGLFFQGEFTGPIIMLSLVALGMAAIVVRLIAGAVRDLAAERNHVTLDIWRIVALVAVIAFVVGSVLRQIAVPGEGVIEADVFMIAGGVVGGASVLAADLTARLLANRGSAQIAAQG